MTELNPETPDNFDRLLAHSEEIAEFVNSFTSERVQRKAFSAIVCSLGLSEDAIQASPTQPLHIVRGAETAEQQRQEPRDEETGNDDAGTPVRKKRGRSGAKKTFTIIRGLNFGPEGHPSLEQFDAEKRPRTNDEKFLVACYYLSNMMGIEDVEIGHILAAFQAAEWTAPAHPDSAMRGAASRTGWIDTANTKSVKVVWKGENYLSKMPVEQPKKTG